MPSPIYDSRCDQNCYECQEVFQQLAIRCCGCFHLRLSKFVGNKMNPLIKFLGFLPYTEHCTSPDGF